MIELLAPAGNLERLKFALLYGADAVYIGGQDFSLRANALNFNLEDMKEGVDFAHSLGKRVYVTTNIVFHNKDVYGLEEYLTELDSISVDGIIFSDMVVLDICNKHNFKFEKHVSTQASIFNHETAKFYKDQGVDRIVLARETSGMDIKMIKDTTGLDIECFVHGAMCTSFSGRCILSNYVTNRDSNRGGCAQVCRFSFNLNDDEEIFSMTPKDLNMVSRIKAMIEVGVNSFKIEGRMRSIYYIATVVSTYRRIIDLIKEDKLTEGLVNYYVDILNRCANRDSTVQFFDELPGSKEQYFLGRDEISNQDFLGFVKEVHDDYIILEQRNYFKVGDKVELFGPSHEPTSIEINEMYNEDGELLDVARHPRMLVKLMGKYNVSVNDMLRLKVFDIEDYL